MLCLLIKPMSPPPKKVVNFCVTQMYVSIYCLNHLFSPFPSIGPQKLPQNEKLKKRKLFFGKPCMFRANSTPENTAAADPFLGK